MHECKGRESANTLIRARNQNHSVVVLRGDCLPTMPQEYTGTSWALVVAPVPAANAPRRFAPGVHATAGIGVPLRGTYARVSTLLVSLTAGCFAQSLSGLLSRWLARPIAM